MDFVVILVRSNGFVSEENAVFVMPYPPKKSVVNLTRSSSNPKVCNRHLLLFNLQVTGLLSLLEDLRKQDLRNRIHQKQGGHLRGKGLNEISDREAGDRRLFIVIGDFNFDSSSSGYNRLVSGGGGLQSAAANCSSAAATTAAGVNTTAAFFEALPSGIDERKGETSRYGLVRGDAESSGADYLGGYDDGRALDFVFYAKGDDGVSCGGYEVRREFSQQRFADGYPSVTEFGVCPFVDEAAALSPLGVL